jgi:hypothetical protein
MAESRFVNLTSYCIVEYISEPIGSSNFLNDDVILLKNNKTGGYQIYNDDGSYTSTKNIKDLTVTSIGGNKVAYLDSEKTPNYVDYDDNLTETVISGYNVVYDRIKFHFISGFNFEDFSALVLSIQNKQNNGIKNIFANIIFSNDTSSDLITFNPKPLFIANSLYDRFIEFKIPSIKNINEDFETALNQALTFSSNITPTDSGYSGFIYNSPISISLSECSKKDIISTDVNEKYDVYTISENYDASISQTNEFDGVGVSVSESSAGDYLEYYLTWNGGFPEELISILNRRNPSDEWVIIHQLSVFEQIGSSFIESSRQVIFQEDNWDEPLTFRPILKNAGSAVSMSVDLLCRLTNKRTGEQIIREGSYVMLSPKKYGKRLITIPLTDEPQSQKVYNKIIKKDFEATRLFIEPTFDSILEEAVNNTAPIPQVTTEYIPVFFTNNNISISNSGIASLKDDSEEVIFGPGKLRFVISPFDNFIKFKLYNVVGTKSIPLDLNSNGAKYKLNFELDSGKISIDNSNSDKLENLSTGEISFRISAKDSSEILKSNSRTIYITSTSQEGTETLMYTGEWRKAVEQSDIDAKIKEARAESDLIKQQASRIKELEDKLNTLQNSQSSEAFKVSESRPIKKKAIAPAVNRIGMRNPKKIKTNTSNAGKKSNN